MDEMNELQSQNSFEKELEIASSVIKKKNSKVNK